MKNGIIQHGSLFSGIGGFDLAAEWTGWDNVFNVENNKWCQQVLSKNFPNTKQYGDIREFDGTKYKGTVDIISGGFPCQPFSVAGKRRGATDDRALWPEMLRVIGEIEPAFVIGENVTGIISLALDQMLTDLENKDYTTETFIIPACAVNAWHRRDRVWIFAYSDRFRSGEGSKKQQTKIINGDVETRKIIANTHNNGCEEQWESITDGAKLFAPKCNSWWETEPAVGRVAHGVPNRVDRIRGLGNAVVPQLVYKIYKKIDHIIKHF